MFKLIVSRHMAELEHPGGGFSSLQEAVREALSCLDVGSLWPVRIENEAGEVLWEQSGPAKTGPSLEAVLDSVT